MTHNQEGFDEDYENSVINEEYKIWKKNAVFLYDMIITHVLDWPSLTVQWLPNKICPADSDYSIQKLILGTNTGGQESNYLMIAKVRLPLDDVNAQIPENTNTGATSTAFPQIENRVNIETRIVHDGEINKAKYMPQKPNIIATKTVSGEVHIFDYLQHPPQPTDEICKPQLRLQGHKAEGYGLNWNTKRDGYLLSGSQDAKIILWDIEAAKTLNSTLQPLVEFNQHKDGVEDVCWHKFKESLFASVGNDKQTILWDSKINKPTHILAGHSSEVYSIDFSSFNEYLFLTGSGEKTVELWDLRQLNKRMHTFQGHNDEVMKVEFSPFNQAIFASASTDRRLIIWDISKIGEELKEEDAKDGPPEMLAQAIYEDDDYLQNDKLKNDK